MAVRAEGIPDLILSPPGTETGRASVPHAPVSNAGSDLSDITVLDRGDKLYAREYPPGSPCPPHVPKPTVSEQEPLFKRLMTLACRRNHKELQEFFFPRGSIEEIIDERVVAETIRSGKQYLTPEPSEAEIAEYARRVIKSTILVEGEERPTSYRKIFAILVLMRRGWEVVLFVQNGISDTNLPLETVLDETQNLVYLRHPSDLATPLSFLEHWGCLEHPQFEEWQWKMVAPFFAKGEGQGRSQFYLLSGKDIMPWTHYEGPIHYGGYSHISRVYIHPCHHKFDNSKVRLALQTILSSTWRTFN